MKRALIIGFFVIVMLIQPVKADNPTPYGYEIIGAFETLHSWNPKYDYYFDTDTAIQFTNHYDEYWSKNVYCLGYKGSNWEYKCTDELNNFNWNIITDNTTYWRATGWKDVTWKGVDLRIAIRYTLNESQDDLIIEPYVENRDTVNIPNDIAFGWYVKDIQVSMNETNNVLEVDNYDYYDLNETLNVFYNNNITYGKYMIERNSNIGFEWMRLKWDESLIDYLNITSKAGQYNAPILLAIRTTGLNAGQNKSTKLLWIDAGCAGEWHADTTADTSDYQKIYDQGHISGTWKCGTNGECPAPDPPGLCSVTDPIGYTGCRISARYSTALADGAYHTTNNWNNGADVKLVDSLVGVNCGQYDLNYAIASNIKIPHNNFTDIKCSVFQWKWYGEPVMACASPAFPVPGSDKTDNFWLNNNTPQAQNVSISPFRPDNETNLTCNYDFWDTNGDTENTSKTSFEWYLQGVAQGINSQTLGIGNTTLYDLWNCSVAVYDNIFETGYEENVSSNETQITLCNYNQTGSWTINKYQICINETLNTTQIFSASENVIVNATLKLVNTVLDIDFDNYFLKILQSTGGKLVIGANSSVK